MTILDALCRRLSDARHSLAVAGAAAAELARLPEDDLSITSVEQARLLVRADRLADRAQDLADELALLVPEPQVQHE
jgi:hypothetical protein